MPFHYSRSSPLDIAAVLSFSLCGLFTLLCVLAFLQYQDVVLQPASCGACQGQRGVLGTLPAGRSGEDDDPSTGKEAGAAGRGSPPPPPPPPDQRKLLYTEIRSSNRRLTYHEHQVGDRWDRHRGRGRGRGRCRHRR